MTQNHSHQLARDNWQILMNFASWQTDVTLKLEVVTVRVSAPGNKTIEVNPYPAPENWQLNILPVQTCIFFLTSKIRVPQSLVLGHPYCCIHLQVTSAAEPSVISIFCDLQFLPPTLTSFLTSRVLYFIEVEEKLYKRD